MSDGLRISGGALSHGFGGRSRDGRPSEDDFERAREFLRQAAISGLPLSDRVLEMLAEPLQSAADHVGGDSDYTEDRQP